MMEIMGMEDHKHTITLPPSCIEPESVKKGQSVSYKVHGKVSAISDSGVTIELDEEEDDDDYEDAEADYDTSDKMGKKLKEKMNNSKALEEYQ